MTFLLKPIDTFLNTKAMYWLVYASLVVLAIVAIVFGFFGIVSYSWLSLVTSLLVLLVVCYGSNYLFATIVSATRNVESVFITAIILFFTLSPATDTRGFLVLGLAGAIAMASKYLLAIRRQHIFNPAAIALVILGLFKFGAMWWVATPSLIPFILVFGFLILRKMNAFGLFFSFFVPAVLTILYFAYTGGASILETLFQIPISWPILFFGAIMLTEPTTTPPQKHQQMLYGALVGVLFGAQFHIGPLFSTPELALVLGNIYSYAVSPKFFSRIVLKEKKEIASNIFEFVFSSPQKLHNIPGQYLEWTLPHKKSDVRGIRRYFTVSSSPSEEYINIGVRVNPEKGSTFKQSLMSLSVGDTVTVSGLSGNFTLPKDSQKKIVFIAGGIGVTPFRSMIKSLVDTKEKRDIVLFYSNKTKKDIAYREVFDQAEKELGIKTVYAITDDTDSQFLPNEEKGMVTMDMIKKYVPDAHDRIFYLSGPQGMVAAFEKTLQETGVRKSAIKTDFFPGFM